jgi:hypothetical protein
MVDLASIEAGLETGLEWVKELAPLAALGGPAAAAIGATVSQVAGMAETVVEQVSGDAAIIAGGDVTKITALRDQLQAENATLTAQAEKI